MSQTRLSWSWERIEYERRGRVAWIRMNRPEKRNALNPQLVQELTEAFTEAENDNRIRVVVLTGKGPAFSAGADLAYLQSLQEASYEENLADSQRLMELFKLIYTLNKPVVALVNGPAIAGGCGLVTVCDFVFSVPSAKFGYTEVRIGFIPALVSVFLVRMLGERKARELLLSGRILSAEEARDIGLVSEIIPESEIEEYVQQFSEKLARETSPESLARTRWLLSRIQNYPFPQSLEFAAEQNARARMTRDCQWGIRRFLKKEPLEW